jgi:hypothetical protein
MLKVDLVEDKRGNVPKEKVDPRMENARMETNM